MSVQPAEDPAPGDAFACDAIETVIVARSRDLGGFAVRRALPSARRRMVGPFIFLDQMGPATFRPGEAFDVRPHPHIGLSTVTYLFDGEIVHRDSLGTSEAIRPGAINLMTAGRGIVHSERTGLEARRSGFSMMGLQAWVALPREAEEGTPSFDHYGAEAMPELAGEGKRVRVLMGSAFGLAAPVRTDWETLYLDAALEPGARLPLDADCEERAIYVAAGEIDIAGDVFGVGSLLILRPGDRLTVTAVTSARFAVLGGATMDGPRHIWWNFVSSSQERIEQAKADWKLGRFDTVPGDPEFIPLPE
ncbi:pirin family protein [Labrys wisconsinensis]|uniref:Redox-sensitive bicupin YhaK (Pirin superfamily) n=1 Tax=Labrys wisconsinensis TaxID=425677 RepID=A0ABU0IZB5_9HYPH|nr:pirin family protein [Labrys wisconsinensis]MDQ0467350.1 redox-sensitive bicupin YhaK (pirin superfamily) [Labrys wisconsinensis]